MSFISLITLSPPSNNPAHTLSSGSNMEVIIPLCVLPFFSVQYSLMLMPTKNQKNPIKVRRKMKLP